MAPPPIRSSKQGLSSSSSSRVSEEAESPSSNLWVGNLSPDVTDNDLMDLFAKYGALDSVTTYSSRSYAFVFFKLVEDATAAKDALQGTQLRANSLKIEFARPAKPCKNLWVGGISSAVTKEQLEEEFLKFGQIEDFKFLRDRSTAFVEFFKLEDASQAMKNMNGKRIVGEQIRVDFLRSQPSRREQLPDFRDPRELPLPYSGVRRAQVLGGRKEGQPSNVLWIGYPPSVQIDEQMLHNAMILFGEIERIKSFPSRHYSFVEFRNVDEARRAKEGLQGRLFNDPHISIMFSSSDLVPAKDYPGFYAGAKGQKPDMFSEHPLGDGQMDVFDPQRVMSLSQFSGSFPHSGVQRPNMPIRPIGPDAALPGAEFNDLASIHTLRDGSSNVPGGLNWRRPSPPALGILPSPALRFRAPVRSSTGWDVLDVHQYESEPKRSRIDVSSSIDDDSFPTRRIDERQVSLERTYGHGASDRGMLGSSSNLYGKSSLGPIGARLTIRGQPLPDSDVDYIWRGLIAKGGTPVCHARCVPIGNGLGSELPEVINCSARTGLDMLTKHYAEAIGFDVVFFLPDSEEDFASYTEFLRYLGTKSRAGVAKLDDGTTLFLVPPSEFLSEVLKVTGPERLYGVVLKLPPQVPDTSSLQPQLHQTINFPQHIDRHLIPYQEVEFNVIPQKDVQVLPVDYNRLLHEDSKLVSKSFYPSTTEAVVAPSISQPYVSSNTPAVSQSGVSLTPELIATLASLLPANMQASASGSSQPVSSSSTVIHPLSSVASDQGILPQGLGPDNQLAGHTVPLQAGNPFAVQPQPSSQFQHYQSVPNVSSYLTNAVPSNTQMQDSTSSIVHQGLIQSRSMTNFASQSGQYALPPQVSQQHQVDAPRSSQVQGINYSEAQSGMPFHAEKVNWDSSNQGQQFPTALPAGSQGTPEVEADKNQRYQSTLQFAANLLLQIQQQQQQQTSSPGVQGTGNQQ